MTPTDLIRSAFQPAVAAVAPDPSKVPDYLAMVKPAANAEHGDYQANFAMPLGKVLGRKPPEVANDLIARGSAADLFETPTVAGPGFINIRLKNSWIADQVQ